MVALRKTIQSAPSVDGKQRMSVFLLVCGIAMFMRLFSLRSSWLTPYRIIYSLLWFVRNGCVSITSEHETAIYIYNVIPCSAASVHACFKPARVSETVTRIASQLTRDA